MMFLGHICNKISNFQLSPIYLVKTFTVKVYAKKIRQPGNNFIHKLLEKLGPVLIFSTSFGQKPPR